jgi:hypothetical protein
VNAVVESRASLRAWGRGLLAGPGALITACLIMAGGALWIPPGRANVDNLVFPIVLFPLLWTALFLYAFLEKKLWRAWAVMGCLSGANAVLLTIHFLR